MAGTSTRRRSLARCRALTGDAASQAESGVVSGVAQHIRQGLLEAATFLLQVREKLTESVVDLVGFLLFGGLGFQCHIIASESIEGPFRSPKEPFNFAPVRFVKLRLLFFRQPHQDEIADEVGLAEIDACRIQAFKEELRIVCLAI